MKILIYDCEIINCIPSKYEKNQPDLSYCKGWSDFNCMGISVIGTWRNFNTFNPFGKYEAFVNYDNSARFGSTDVGYKFQDLLLECDLLIGFNSLSFDDKLCRANNFILRTEFDLLVEVRKASGQGDGTYQYGITRQGYALKDLARENLPYNKSASGELAPVMWQRGQKQEVIDYCLRDIKITKELYFKFTNNQLIDPVYGEILIGDRNLQELNQQYVNHKKWVYRAWQFDDLPF
jgi:hypothetical protein